MNGRRILRFSAIAQAFVACVSGCENGETLPPIRYETETVVVGTSFEDPLCAGDLAFLDERVKFLEAKLDVQARLPIAIYLYDFGEVPCETTAFGCYSPETREIKTLWQDVDHELVHAVAHSVPFPSRFWSEGVAEAFNDSGTHIYEKLVPAELSSNERPNYSNAGHFVRWLIETYGLESLNRAVRRESLEEVYGMSADQLVTEFNETAPWGYPAWNPCKHPEIPAIREGEWEEVLTFSCETEGARGTEWEGTSMVRALALEAGTYEISISGGLGAVIVGCQMEALEEDPPLKSNGDIFNQADASQTAFGTFFESDNTHVITITDGVYRFAISSGVEELMTVGISVRRVE